MTLSSKEKRHWRAEGNRLKPEVWIGKDGISPGSITTVNNSLRTKELVKIKLQESCPVEKQTAAQILARKTGAEVVQIMGNTFLLYRPLPKDDA